MYISMRTYCSAVCVMAVVAMFSLIVWANINLEYNTAPQEAAENIETNYLNESWLIKVTKHTTKKLFDQHLTKPTNSRRYSGFEAGTHSSNFSAPIVSSIPDHIESMTYHILEPRSSATSRRIIRGSVPLVSDDSMWTTVVENKVFIYSAHLDPQPHPDPNITGFSVIRIVAAMWYSEIQLLERDKSLYFCKVFIHNSNGTIMEMTASLGILVEINNFREMKWIRLMDVQLFCNLDIPTWEFSTASVSVIKFKNDKPNVSLNVNQQFKLGQQRRYTVCLSQPIFGSLDPELFVEWVEMNRIFGAEKIRIYLADKVESIGPHLEYYEKIDVVETVSWWFPWSLDALENTSHARLQGSMLRDCQFQLQGYSRYITVVDADELIVPRHPDDVTWDDMIRRSGCDKDERVTSFAARHLFFCLCFPKYNIETNLVISSHLLRDQYIFEYHKHSKYIARSGPAIYNARLITHYVANKLDNHPDKTCVLDPSVGGNHHYRSNISLTIIRREEENYLTRDSTITKYTIELQSRKADVLQNIQS